MDMVCEAYSQFYVMPNSLKKQFIEENAFMNLNKHTGLMKFHRENWLMQNWFLHLFSMLQKTFDTACMTVEPRQL